MRQLIILVFLSLCIHYHSNAQFITAFDGEVYVGGFTMLGAAENSPRIKSIKLEGTTTVSNAAQRINHGVDDPDKILAVQIIAEFIFDGPNYTPIYDYTISGDEIEFQVPGLVQIGRPFKVFIIYEQ